MLYIFNCWFLWVDAFVFFDVFSEFLFIAFANLFTVRQIAMTAVVESVVVVHLWEFSATIVTVHFDVVHLCGESFLYDLFDSFF